MSPAENQFSPTRQASKRRIGISHVRLDRRAFLRASALATGAVTIGAPASMLARYTYGARGDLPPVTMTWYQGTKKPVYYTEDKIPKWGMAILFVGDQGLLLSDYEKHVLLPEEKFKDFKRPDPFIPASPGHFEEWLMACKTGQPTGSNFDYAAALTMANHLGNVAYRTGKKLQWDPVELKVRNVPEADRLIRKSYRKNWNLA